jgi:hypothetical protein
MGLTNSNEDQHITQLFDDRFGGRIDIVTRKNKTYVVKTVTVVSEEELKWMVDLSIKRARLKHKNFCTIRNYEVNKKQDMCSKATVISLYFDYLHNDLEKEIEARAESQV